MIPLVLASASPARLSTLQAAGIDPAVQVSGVDEDAVLDGLPAGTSVADAVLALARAKAEWVAAAPPDGANGNGLVLGCDSMLDLDGRALGKPADADDAVARWRAMRGRSGVLHTGHWLVDLRDAPSGHGATSSTVVQFADLSDREVDSYVATGEPLAVAGAFTVDGLGGPFVTRIEGDHHGVVGLSLPLLRDLLARVGATVVDLWRPGVHPADDDA